MSSTKRKWAKRLVMCCIGVALGGFVQSLDSGKSGKAVAYLLAAVCANGWRVAMNLSDRWEEDSNYWRGLWLNSVRLEHQSGHADGMGPLEVVSSEGGSTVENVEDREDM